MQQADPSLKSRITALATQLGFDDCRIAKATRAPHAETYLKWIDDGKHGDMEWMARNTDRRVDPREVLPGVRSIIVLALNYYPGEHQPEPDHPGATGRIARYAWNDDYHDLVVKKLKAFNAALEEWGGTQRYYVDTGPVLERDFAHEAGVGWNGKSTVQIHRRLGTWFFLCELLTTLELEPDSRGVDHCGSCTRCMDACPTNAITSPHRLDARRCISYLTIEHKGPIPLEFRKAIGDRIYGCDECLHVCPWNRFAQTSKEASFHARQSIFKHTLRDFLALDDKQFRELFSKSPIKRSKRPRFLRNVCVALGNVGTSDDLPALNTASNDPDPLISEHADWAIKEIQRRQSA